MTAEIAGLVPVREFVRLPEALDALVAEVRRLGVSPWHRESFELCVRGVGAVERIAGRLVSTGLWTEVLYVGEAVPVVPHTVTVRSRAGR